MGLGRDPTAPFLCPRFVRQPGFHGPGCEGKPGNGLEYSLQAAPSRLKPGLQLNAPAAYFNRSSLPLRFTMFL